MVRYKVIIYGLPMCAELDPARPDHATIGGFWSWVFHFLPWTGAMMIYERSYLEGLWHWLFNPPPDFDGKTP